MGGDHGEYPEVPVTQWAVDECLEHGRTPSPEQVGFGLAPFPRYHRSLKPVRQKGVKLRARQHNSISPSGGPRDVWWPPYIEGRTGRA